MEKKTLLLIFSILLFASLAATEKASAGTSTIAVYPTNVTVDQPGQEFNITIKITNAPQGTQYIINNITWNPAYIELRTGTDADIVEGPFMKTFGPTTFLAQGFFAGRIGEVTCALMSGEVTEGSSGDLFIIRFRSKAVGTTNVNIQIAYFLWELEVVDEPTLQGGTVTVIPEFSTAILLIFLMSATAIALLAKKFITIKQPK